MAHDPRGNFRIFQGRTLIGSHAYLPFGPIQGILDCDWPHQDHVTSWWPGRLKYPRTRQSGRGAVLQGRAGLLLEEREKGFWGSLLRLPWARCWYKEQDVEDMEKTATWSSHWE